MLSQELSRYLAERSERFKHEKRPKRERSIRTDKLLAQAKARIKPQHQSQQKQPDDFLGIPCKRVTFKVPPKAEREAMRTEFEQVKRVEFIKFLAETQQDALKKAGVTNKQLEGMKKGYTPHGFNTHHKLPIYGGGTNDFSNLVLVRREPWHDMMHYHLINPQVKNMFEGDARQVVIPDLKTCVFVPAPQYVFIEKWAKKGKKTYGKNKNISMKDIQAEVIRRTVLRKNNSLGR